MYSRLWPVDLRHARELNGEQPPVQYAMRELARQVMEENRLLALQQREKERYHRELYENVPTEAFYEQFNTTTR